MQFRESANPVAVSSPGEHSCFVAVICCSDVAPDSRVAQSVRQGTGERRASSRTVQKLEVFQQPLWISLSRSGQQLEVLLQYFSFYFSIVAQRPRVSPPSRLGAADGLLVPLAHGLMRTPCDE